MQEGSTTRQRFPWALLFGLMIGLALGSGLMLVVQWRNRPPIWADGPWVFFQGARYKHVHVNSASKALASFKSAVSKPSVNQL